MQGISPAPKAVAVAFPEAAQIVKAIEQTKKKEAHNFSSAFRDLDNERASEGWGLLRQVFSFLEKFGDPVAPFGPMAVSGRKRSMIPDDLTDENLIELAPTLDAVADPEYRARIGDILWLRRRDARAARVAVAAYLESGARLEDIVHWTASMKRYERAARLARQVDSKGDLPKKVLAHLQDRVRHYRGKDESYFSLKALTLLEEFRFGEFAELAEIAKEIAAKSRAAGTLERARKYYDVQARFDRRAGRADRAEAALVDSAETHVLEAETREAAGEYIAAHLSWGNAITAFRDRPSLRPRLPQLQQRYAAAGENTRAEMKTISHSMDIGDVVEASRGAVRGLPWDDAFFTLVAFEAPIDPNELRTSTLKQMEEHPLQSTIVASIFDASGRKVGVRPAAFTEDPAEYEAAVTGFMEQNAGFRRGLTVQARLAPAIQQIVQEHQADSQAIQAVIGDSGLFPEDRKLLFSKAFAAGFQWDFVTALHLLVPQVENALRHVLAQNGVTPTNVDANGIEEAWGLERILAHAKISEIFGAALVFELRSLLVERLGSNLRNLLAHGLVSPGALNADAGLYLWWIFLRLAALPTAGMDAFIERSKLATQQL